MIEETFEADFTLPMKNFAAAAAALDGTGDLAGALIRRGVGLISYDPIDGALCFIQGTCRYGHAEELLSCLAEYTEGQGVARIEAEDAAPEHYTLSAEGVQSTHSIEEDRAALQAAYRVLVRHGIDEGRGDLQDAIRQLEARA